MRITVYFNGVNGNQGGIFYSLNVQRSIFKPFDISG